MSFLLIFLEEDNVCVGFISKANLQLNLWLTDRGGVASVELKLKAQNQKGRKVKCPLPPREIIAHRIKLVAATSSSTPPWPTSWTGRPTWAPATRTPSPGAPRDPSLQETTDGHHLRTPTDRGRHPKRRRPRRSSALTRKMRTKRRTRKRPKRR